MHDVGGGVGARGRLPAPAIDLGDGILTGAHLSRLHDAEMHDRLRPGPLRIDHANGARDGADLTHVADLAARLGVEGCCRKEDTDLLALLADVEFAILRIQERHDGALGFGLRVADERRRRHRAGVETDRNLPGGIASSLALLLQENLETFGIDRESGIAGKLLGQLQREAERVGQLERHIACQGGAVDPYSVRR